VGTDRDKDKGDEGMAEGKTNNEAGSGLAKKIEMSGGAAVQSDGEEDEFGVLQVHD